MSWFEIYSEFKTHDFYMTGESYAGIYVPMTFHNIHKHNEKHKDDKAVFKPKIKGWLLVNAVTNRHYDGFLGQMEFAHGHFLISDEQYNEFLAVKDECKFHLFGTDEWDTMPNVMKCYRVWLRYYYSYSGNYNPYSIYGKCYRPSDDRIGLLELKRKYSCLQLNDTRLKIRDLIGFMYHRQI